jgi:hypothetical protein
MPETPPMIKTSNINYSLLFIFSSIFLEVLKSKNQNRTEGCRNTNKSNNTVTLKGVLEIK